MTLKLPFNVRMARTVWRVHHFSDYSGERQSIDLPSCSLFLRAIEFKVDLKAGWADLTVEAIPRVFPRLLEFHADPIFLIGGSILLRSR